VLLHKDSEGSRLEISSYEVSWAIAESLLSLAIRGNEPLGRGQAKEMVERLVLAGRYAEASIVRLPRTAEAPTRGWCSDHPYGRPMIESWTCATVLHSAISLYHLIEAANRQDVLATFSVIEPNEGWPDWLQWDNFRTNSEPDSERPVFEHLHQHIVVQILTDPQHLPRVEKENVSVVLFGPPGTSKTTVVKAIATALGWPVVMLSPGDFIAKGLEYIEAQAASIFSRLQQLHHAIVLFDECDELFRDRHPNEQNEQTRGIAAFVTASMLPKLQDLHDRGRVIFFICTNMIESLDSAIRRPGRVDHILYVGPPDETARLRWINEIVTIPTGRAHSDVACQELARRTEGFLRKELQRAVKLLFQAPSWETPEEAKHKAKMVALQIRPSLTISVEELGKFNDQRKEFSRPPYVE